MGVYKGLTKTTGIYKVVGQVGFVQVFNIRRQKAELAGVGRVKGDPRKIDVDCPKLS